MSRGKHLDKIVAKCRELLATAEKRTPGKWTAGGRYDADYVDKGDDYPFCVLDSHDAAYIAACAGLAEAGWRATIAAIESCREIRSPETGEVLDAICAAWTEESS
jgi:hypothetical protein